MGGSPQVRAIEALTELEHLSAEINRSWPDEKRFHFKVVDLPPAVLVEMTFRNRATFSFFAASHQDNYGKPTNRWKVVGALDDHRAKPIGGYDWLDLFRLEQGPAKRARFLAKFGDAGCGSGVGVAYYAYEWNPENTGDLSEFIKLEGAVSQYDRTDNRQSGKGDLPDSFSPIGELRTRSRLIELPYCWFSAVDTWNNPSLCAADSYDLSGDRVRFIDTVFNRPDLVAVAKAIEHSQAHDYWAVLAYCGSADVARQMLRDVPSLVFGAGGLNVTRNGTAKETVEIVGQETFHFDVERREGRWLVIAFRVYETSN